MNISFNKGVSKWKRLNPLNQVLVSYQIQNYKKGNQRPRLNPLNQDLVSYIFDLIYLSIAFLLS